MSYDRSGTCTSIEHRIVTTAEKEKDGKKKTSWGMQASVILTRKQPDTFFVRVWWYNACCLCLFSVESVQRFCSRYKQEMSLKKTGPTGYKHQQVCKFYVINIFIIIIHNKLMPKKQLKLHLHSLFMPSIIDIL